MLSRSRLVVALVASAALFAASPAVASVGDEVRAGGAVAQRLQAGTTSCDTLTAGDFESLGEFVMDRMVGSRAQHEAMNARMTAMLGATGEARMHELMGRRYAGCGTTGAGAMMAPGMMGGSLPGGDWGAMMNSRGYTWMHNGTWQHMSRADWHGVGAAWMGPGMMGTGNHGWSTDAVVFAALGTLAMLALVAGVGRWRPWHRRSAPSAPA